MADRDWRSDLEGPSLASNVVSTNTARDWRSELDEGEPAKPFDAPFMPELRAAADQQQTAMDNADELPFRVTSTISGAYGALDRVLNIPNYAMQATLPASQRKPINLQADFESVVPIAAQMRAKYPQAYAQRANFAGMAAPVPAVGKGKDLLGTVLKQGAAGAAYGVAGVPDEALKHKQDITLPMLGKAAAVGAGFGALLGAGLHGLERLMAGRQQAVARGADDVAMTSNVDVGDVDESLLAALGLVKQQKPEAPKPNVMAAATARPDFLKGGVTLNQYQAQTAKMLSKAEPYIKQPNAFEAATARPIFATPKMEADRLDAFMKGTMREAEARVQAIRKAQAQEAAGVQARAQSAKKRVEEIRAKLDNAKQAEEALDAAVNYPLSFKKFKDNGITWTAAGLSDEKLHQYADTLAKQANTASGGAKRAAMARAEAINQEITRRQSIRKQGGEPTTPDKVPTQPTQEVPPAPVPTEASNNDIREIQHKLAVEEFVPSQLDEAVRLADVVNKEAQARNLLPSVIGAERALEGVPLQVAVQKGQVTPEFAQRVQEIADAAYTAKRLEMQTDLLREAIVGSSKTDVKVGKLTFKAKRDYSSEHDISRNREAGEAIEAARKGKDVEVGQRAGHLRAIVGDGGTNLALREAVRQEMGAKLQQPIEAMAADWQVLHKALTSTAKATPGARDVSKRLRGAAYSEFEALKQLHSKPDNMWSLNTVVDTLPDGTKVRCGIECVTEHAIKQFSDEAKAADMQKVIQAQLDSNNAWLKKPGVTLSPTQKAQIVAGLTTLGTMLHDTAAHAADSPLVTAASTWASLGGGAQGLVAIALGSIPIGKHVARNILESGALGRLKIPLSNVLLGRAITLADNFRNTRDRIVALNKIVKDVGNNLQYQNQLTAEYWRLSSQLHDADADVVATALFELKNKLLTPEEAAQGLRSASWAKLQPNQRLAVLKMRGCGNAMGNRLKRYADRVVQYQNVATEVINGRVPIQYLHALETTPSKTLDEVRRKLEATTSLFHSLGYQLENLNPVGAVEGFLEKGSTQYTANFNQNAFGQKNWAFQFMTFFDGLILGNSYAGVRNMALAASDRATNGELNALLKSFHFMGERAGDIRESQISAAIRDTGSLAAKAKRATEGIVNAVGAIAPGLDRERINAEELALAVIYRYYNKNKQHVGSISRQEFAKRVLKAQGLKPEAIADCWNEIVIALDEVHAVSPFNLSTNILSESKNLSRLIGWFAKQPAREARLVLTYLSKGDWQALATFYTMKAVVAGKAAIPFELWVLFHLMNDPGAQELSDSMDSLSIYSAIDSEGTMSPKMEWGYAWFLMAGRQAPMQAMGESLMRFIENKHKELNDTGDISFTNEDALTVANGALPAIPGGQKLPVKPALNTLSAVLEAQGKPVKAYPKKWYLPSSAPPDFNRKQESSIDELGIDPLVHILRAPFAPAGGASKYKESVTREFQSEDYKATSDALAQFFANKVLKK